MPRSGVGYLSLGALYHIQGDLGKSLDQYQRALEREPASAQAMRNIVSIYLARKESEKAFDFCRDQIKAHKENPRFLAFLYSQQGNIYLFKRDIKKAEESFNAAINQEPEMLAPYTVLARIYLATNRMDEAIKKYQEIHAKQPKFLPAIMSLGVLHEAKNDYNSAEKFYQKALDIKPDYAPAANNLAWRMIERGGNIDKALSLAQMAKEKFPDNPGIADTLGWAFFHKNAFMSAIAQFEEALEKMPQNPTVHFHLGMAYFKKGDPEKAKQELQKALQLNPNFPENEKAKEVIGLITPVK